ncbi:bifunctional phosphopantothenoylcysteine decarboxylase/phosphopantothenate--cysteine ligase CoaBC [Williamwhitmania taraxaci]|uniref:Coenzyme A biosynthesis bifunctional protein CoaBC n=1 Tax=Williamwhitmania taraxaci TaxID=1640674 RepID=A0A1G6K6J6_9BACT|nr:bifunctional phosphopantothenoylcysteine decarboxylase/phosphopantothenate--cysteine ligase CoaBC [Williamwhitmania taraxaci]SDC26692.1 phosphopantothenoylcysteine decarboxylase / phosphopantothenate--cysteine ligase [Williamwhitmania taraxaci]
MLKGKHIIIGVTGSIAAYKAAHLIRLLKKEECEVKVIMTPLAKEFITPLTLATLAKSPILVDFFNPENGDWNSHVDLGMWADAYLIAPATANTMGKMANGIADNLLLTTYLSAKCPVFVAPAMDLDMFQHAATQNNIQKLRSYGNHIIEPTAGELASGLIGKGRMEEPEQIVAYLSRFFDLKKKLNGKICLVNAGPTYEAIDPVRFIGNHSTGKMGFAIAYELAERGAQVELISGPTNETIAHPNISVTKITSAAEMAKVCISKFHEVDIAVLSAAVADFTPVKVVSEKIKREKENYTIELTPTTDIAAELGKIKRQNQIVVGFALETNNEEVNAKTKLKRKNLDFIVLNSLQDVGAGFGQDTNKIKIYSKTGEEFLFELKTKKEVATDIVDAICNIQQ